VLISSNSLKDVDGMFDGGIARLLGRQDLEKGFSKEAYPVVLQ
jgi:hypothetical protein